MVCRQLGEPLRPEPARMAACDPAPRQGAKRGGADASLLVRALSDDGAGPDLRQLAATPGLA